MGLSRALEISASGIRAEGKNLEIISSNIANMNATRTLDGGAYRRRIAVYQEKPITFEQALDRAAAKLAGGGVEIKEVVEDQSPLQKVYDPTHPDADNLGFVQMPNVNLSKEMVDMIYGSKLYEANITVYNSTKQMMRETLQLQ
ncbi:flagellar basal body rod protein FlgC [candidate division WOR-1 bacterium RIFOXYA12_FULL_43_27]|uniref:Flagellar basal-body rod protein FlgC n=1 Tax=candidate division WOR-1 bacterium RIFOXYC2_FULL_46_14 TaxID=1802587 RepID=A0A1F4U3B6_UNCSA|nr:MAG: flagellar basal body rod protein FlgC [candidate division WOR-1 bacterium RIFOXYA12_FULL_43_27]OGC19101.1 MAG: flagellar basal body rod protein FlgC [candidate division WOR-1 bacterium RIFOXYB2_FULL_46_45]OGC30089.1 MAG: flagellar basal body rod protein FlgC [candidate division WOR-1 bacterium RIFOXYA2_FULL_46_56]OGC39330.1 MAG: flagellar basal body rod protein FlgC [candidate division WOR-1 bacterium RIFOXYC2_FULL_46_14]